LSSELCRKNAARGSAVTGEMAHIEIGLDGGASEDERVFDGSNQKYEELMSKEAAEHHKQASEHHAHAARHHGEAAKHHEAGWHETAAHHAHTARGHAVQATEHAENAAKAHAEEHGKK
jgi:hypothetical protein